MKLQVFSTGALALICLASGVIGLGFKSGEGERVQCCPALLPSLMGWGGWGQDLVCPTPIGHELFACTQELCGKDTCNSNSECEPGYLCCCRNCNNQCLQGNSSSGSRLRMG